MKDNFMKNFIKVVKVCCLSLCSLFVIFELLILINATRLAEIPADLLMIEADEIDTAQVPLANVVFEVANEIDGPDLTADENIENETVDDVNIDEAEIPVPQTDENNEDNELEAIVPVEITAEPPIEPINDSENVADVEFIIPTEPETEAEILVNPPSVELIPKNMPVLMYHTSSENNPGALSELYVKPSEFEKQIQYLSENGFTFCTFDDYYNLNNIDKPIFITFDDGYKENYTEIFPILKKYNAKITLFLVLSSVTETNLTRDMIIEMSDSGLVKFESHTNTHPSLVAISANDARLTDEIQNSKLKIEEITGKPVNVLSYPNGEFNEKVKQKTKEFYSFGIRKDLGMHNTEYDPYEVRRIRINRSTPLASFIGYVGG